MRVVACSTIYPTFCLSLVRLLPSLSPWFLDLMALFDDHSVRKHVYEALESSQHIRLIILHPASSADLPLNFTFHQARLSELEGRYEAISYTWGQPNLTYPLYVSDGTHILVTENLDRALRYLRWSHKDRTLWADAACINQADDVEKGTQIPLMIHIFRNAETVLAWLDPGSAVSRFQNLGSTLEKMGNMSRKRRHDMPTLNSRIIAKTIEKEIIAPILELFEEVTELLRLPWFTRRWIVQEVVFNPEVRLIYGDVELSWARFVVTMTILSALPRDNPLPKFWSAVTEIARLWRYYSLFENFSRLSESYETDIVKLLGDFDQHECTDPRDRIFALYNMTSNLRPSIATLHHRDVLMKIDYSLDLRQTYEAFALACMRAGKLRAIIGAVLSRQDSARPHGWASWVPDWRVNSLQPITLPERVKFGMPPQAEEWSTCVIRMEVKAPEYLMDERYTAYPIIMEKAAGDTLPKQYPNLYTKIARTNTDEDLTSLFGMVRYMVQQHDSESEFDLCSVLELLQRRRNEPYDALSQRLHSLDLDALEPALSTFIRQGENMFSFEMPGVKRRSVGFGNTHLEVGDKLVPLFETNEIRRDSTFSHLGVQKFKMVLIVRRAGTINTRPSPDTIYRLIGSGYVYDMAAFEDERRHLRYKNFSNGFRTLYLA
ncbi:hypothetical protein IG631_11334 [Alternaria alternata]|nr:hypothetical protein IG631_11334 [Alternaria alternata]